MYPSCSLTFVPFKVVPFTLYLQPQLTVPKPFNFVLERRMEERHEFDDSQHKKQLAAEKREKELRVQQEREEKEEIRRYRKSLDFKVG